MRPANSHKVRFRELAPADTNALFAGAFGVDEVTRHLQWETHQRLDETRALVDEMIELHQGKEKFFWVAVHPREERMVGLGSIKPDGATAWIGFLVFAEDQGKGLGAAILSALEKTVLQNLASVSAAVESENRASIHLLQQAGWETWDCPEVNPLKAYRKYRPDRHQP